MFYLFFLLLGFLGPGFGLFSEGPWFLDDLNLPPDVLDQVQRMHFKHKEKIIDLNASLQKENLKLQKLLMNMDLSQEEFLAQVDRISELRNALIKEKAIFLFNLKKILPPEEWQKLKDQILERRQSWKGGPKGRQGLDENFQRKNFRR